MSKHKSSSMMDFLEMKHQHLDYANWISAWIPLAGALMGLAAALAVIGHAGNGMRGINAKREERMTKSNDRSA